MFRKECVHPVDFVQPRKKGRPRKVNEHKEGFWEWIEAKDIENLKKSLDSFLSETKDLVSKKGLNRTQRNESLNLMITRVAPKNKIFNTSNEARSAIAVGRMNSHNFDSELISSLYPNTLSQPMLDEIKKDEDASHQNLLFRNIYSQRKKRNDARNKFRQNNKDEDGDYKKSN